MPNTSKVVNDKIGIHYTIIGTLANNFICKKVNDRIMYQSKIFLNNNDLKESIIKEIKQNSLILPNNTKLSNSILLNIWNVEIYEQHKLFLEKGATIEVSGLLKYKLYNRFCGGQKLQIFFNVNNISKIKQPLYLEHNDFLENNRLPEIVYYQF